SVNERLPLFRKEGENRTIILLRVTNVNGNNGTINMTGHHLNFYTYRAICLAERTLTPHLLHLYKWIATKRMLKVFTICFGETRSVVGTSRAGEVSCVRVDRQILRDHVSCDLIDRSASRL